jgi:pyruvate/2-oxoglutarate dehydrogenase complex dihydrolipoamide acyltransferase (E2) component
VGVGQRVEREQSLVVLESDKATMDVPSPAAGVIREMKVAVGETVSQGTLIALDSDGSGEAAGRRRACGRLGCARSRVSVGECRDRAGAGACAGARTEIRIRAIA